MSIVAPLAHQSILFFVMLQLSLRFSWLDNAVSERPPYFIISFVFDLHSGGQNLEEHCYHRLADATIVLGILKEANSYKAVYQYFGEIVCHSVQVCDGIWKASMLASFASHQG